MTSIERRFEMTDQLAFADWSGDHNPIHVDPVAARRTQIGRPVVHGVHTLLWALDRLCAAETMTIGWVKVAFPAPVCLGDDVRLEITKRSPTETRAQATVDGTPVVTIRVASAPPRSFAAATFEDASDVAAADWPREPIDLAIEKMSGCRGALRPREPVSDIAAAFPALRDSIGETAIAAFAAASRVVGMVCPGLHSILASIEVELKQHDGPALHYAVTAVDDRFRTVDLAIRGGGLVGTVGSFARMPPTLQPSVAAVAERVAHGAYAGIDALVIGGSRGIGEMAAKALAMGGADVTITYRSGQADAERVAEQIRAAGGACAALPFDVRGDVAEQVVGFPTIPRHIYYFATSPIFVRRARLFDEAVLAEFLRFYVSAFAALVKAVRARSQEPLTIFYPSSVAVLERPLSMTEYAMAKAAGEILCEDIGRNDTGVKVVVQRLPRVLTDQTATLQAAKSEPVLDVVMAILGAMTQ